MAGKTGTKKQQTQNAPKLTRPMRAGDWECPCHGRQVELAHRRFEDDQGRSRYGGSYYRCPEYRECGYYVSIDTRTVPATDGNGIALGRFTGGRKEGKR